MKIGIIGLGKMGRNMTIRLVRGGHEVIGYARTAKSVDAAVEHGAIGAYSLEELAQKLDTPRYIWLMIPAGDPVEQTLHALLPHLEPNDVIVDGGNSNYKDTIRRAHTLQEQGLHYIDVGTSGGVWGLTEGYSMMVGGEKRVVEALRPILEILAPAPTKDGGTSDPAEPVTS